MHGLCWQQYYSCLDQSLTESYFRWEILPTISDPKVLHFSWKLNGEVTTCFCSETQGRFNERIIALFLSLPSYQSGCFAVALNRYAHASRQRSDTTLKTDNSREKNQANDENKNRPLLAWHFTWLQLLFTKANAELNLLLFYEQSRCITGNEGIDAFRKAAYVK